MEAIKAKSIEFIEEENQKPPKGAKILRKSVSMVVRKIQNGYLLEKRYDVKYQVGENVNYSYWNDTYYSLENPIDIKQKVDKKDLIDNF